MYIWPGIKLLNGKKDKGYHYDFLKSSKSEKNENRRKFRDENFSNCSCFLLMFLVETVDSKT